MEIEHIRRAFAKYKENPSRTSRMKLKKAKHKGWLVLEQNPRKDSTFAEFVENGLEIQHILYDNDYYGFIINGTIYMRPKFIEEYLGNLDIIRDKLDELKGDEDYETADIGKVKMYYLTGEDDEVKFLYYTGTRVHRGIEFKFLIDAYRKQIKKAS